jgi:hypothetical protein
MNIFFPIFLSFSNKQCPRAQHIPVINRKIRTYLILSNIQNRSYQQTLPNHELFIHDLLIKQFLVRRVLEEQGPPESSGALIFHKQCVKVFQQAVSLFQINFSGLQNFLPLAEKLLIPDAVVPGEPVMIPGKRVEGADLDPPRAELRRCGREKAANIRPNHRYTKNLKLNYMGN